MRKYLFCAIAALYTYSPVLRVAPVVGRCIVEGDERVLTGIIPGMKRKEYEKRKKEEVRKVSEWEKEKTISGELGKQEKRRVVP